MWYLMKTQVLFCFLFLDLQIWLQKYQITHKLLIFNQPGQNRGKFLFIKYLSSTSMNVSSPHGAFGGVGEDFDVGRQGASVDKPNI
jgi:hypothetical protein